MEYPQTKIKFWREIILLLFALGIARLLVASLSCIKFSVEGDEGHYLFYGLKVLEGGVFVFKDLFKTYLENSGFWGFPLPLRFGFALESALFCRIFGQFFVSLSLVSVFSFFCSVFVAYRFGRRVFGADTAFLSCLLFLASPLALGLSLRALCDSASNFFVLSVFLIQLDYYLRGGAKRERWMIAAVYICALAFKETNILFIVPLAASSIPFYTVKEWRRMLVDWALMYVLPAILLLAVYLLFFGSLRQILAAAFFLPSAKAHWYVANMQSGPWFRYLVDFLLISPLVAILGFYFVAHALSAAAKREETATALFILGVILVFSLFAKNLRYVGAMDYPLRVFTALALYHFFAKNKNQFALVFMVIALICLSDVAVFYNLFIQGNMYDPVSRGLLSYWNFLPKSV